MQAARRRVGDHQYLGGQFERLACATQRGACENCKDGGENRLHLLNILPYSSHAIISGLPIRDPSCEGFLAFGQNGTM
jgi:hypothetical protein